VLLYDNACSRSVTAARRQVLCCEQTAISEARERLVGGKIRERFADSERQTKQEEFG
jgi:hypothetical protein